jgi:tetrahydromethanopterin S-methyltransferase subunit F
MPPTQETEVDQLRDIMESLPDSSAYEGERREYTLTKGDVLLIYRIAKVANTPHVCPFERDDVETLQSAAQNISRTQKIASVVIVTALVGGMISGIWFALKLLILDFVKRPIA